MDVPLPQPQAMTGVKKHMGSKTRGNIPKQNLLEKIAKLENSLNGFDDKCATLDYANVNDKALSRHDLIHRKIAALEEIYSARAVPKEEWMNVSEEEWIALPDGDWNELSHEDLVE
jgi:hypothetical protein